MNKYPKDWDFVIDNFADAMRTKVAMHVSKGDWKDMKAGELYQKAKDEMKELAEAIGIGNATEALLEAADVALSVMMAADIMMGSPRPSLRLKKEGDE